jgi:glycopeptide antibiotics resistance protein
MTISSITTTLAFIARVAFSIAVVLLMLSAVAYVTPQQKPVTLILGALLGAVHVVCIARMFREAQAWRIVRADLMASLSGFSMLITAITLSIMHSGSPDTGDMMMTGIAAWFAWRSWKLFNALKEDSPPVSVSRTSALAEARRRIAEAKSAMDANIRETRSGK